MKLNPNNKAGFFSVWLAWFIVGAILIALLIKLITWLVDEANKPPIHRNPDPDGQVVIPEEQNTLQAQCMNMPGTNEVVCVYCPDDTED